MRVYMFPGQGSQYKGMGADLFNLYPDETEKASKILGYPIDQLCLEDKNNQLHLTQYTQPSIYFVSCLMYLTTLKKGKMPPECVIGHSLGEYAALFAAGVFDLFSGLHIVKKRAEVMNTLNNGSMMAVIGQEATRTPDILRENDLLSLDLANINTSQQVVLSGLKKDLSLAKSLLEKYSFKCIELNVSGAFHSRHMENARKEFMRYLVTQSFSPPTINIISSYNGQKMDVDYMVEILGFQLVRSVKWMETILHLVSLGVKEFVEIGPSEVLTRLNKQILQDHN